MPIVNYIREHEWFIEFAADEGLTANDVALYDAILFFVNRKAEGNVWPDDFIRIRNDRLLTYCHMGFDAMSRSRNKLKQKGVIDFHNGSRNKESPAYRIIYKYPDSFPPDKFCPPKTDNNANKATDKAVNNNTGKSADLIPNYTRGRRQNQNGIDTHTDSTSSNRARGRLDETYIDSAGRERQCRFDSAFMTSDRARKAVVQRILDQFNGDMDCKNVHFTLARFLQDGMPPEILEDEIGRYNSLRRYEYAMKMIFRERKYKEQRDEIEKKRCLEDAHGNPTLAQFYYKNSERYVPDEEL